MFFPTGLLALSIVVLSAWTLNQSYASISNVKIYEEKAEKAADWSNTAKTRLWATRYTIGAGFVASLVSLVSGLVYLLVLNNNNASQKNSWWTLCWPVLLSAALMGAERYMQRFWATKAKMPLLDQYNAAIKQSLDVVTLLSALMAGWGVMGLLKLCGL